MISVIKLDVQFILSFFVRKYGSIDKFCEIKQKNLKQTSDNLPDERETWSTVNIERYRGRILCMENTAFQLDIYMWIIKQVIPRNVLSLWTKIKLLYYMIAQIYSK